MTLKEKLQSLPWINISKLEKACGLKRNIIQLYEGGRPIPEKHIPIIWKELSKTSMGYIQGETKIVDVINTLSDGTKETVLTKEAKAKLKLKTIPIIDNIDLEEQIEIELLCGHSNHSMTLEELSSDAIIIVNDIEYHVKDKYLIEVENEEKGLMFKSFNKALIKKKYLRKYNSLY